MISSSPRTVFTRLNNILSCATEFEETGALSDALLEYEEFTEGSAHLSFTNSTTTVGLQQRRGGAF